MIPVHSAGKPEWWTRQWRKNTAFKAERENQAFSPFPLLVLLNQPPCCSATGCDETQPQRSESSSHEGLQKGW